MSALPRRRLLLGLLGCQLACGTYFPNVTYFSFIGTNVPESPPATETLLSIVAQADDSPYQEVPLPWVFTLFGIDIDSVWVSPNGALFSSKVPYSSDPNYAYDARGLNGSYFGTIDPYTVDLNPSESSGSRITWYNTSDNVTIAFRNIPLFYDAYHNINGGSPLNTFRVDLHSDSHIVFHYDDITTPAILAAHNYPMFSGIRSFDSYQRCSFSASQLSAGQTDWGTGIPGVYPPLSGVVSGNQFTVCPVSTVWAVSPAEFDASPLSAASAALTLTPLSLGCGSLVRFSVLLEGRSDAPAPCRLTNASADPSVPVLSCDASSWRNLSLAYRVYTISVQWSAIDGSGSPSGVLDIPAISLVVTNGTSSSFCAMNTAIDGCNACAVSGGSFECLNSTCSSVYETSSCSGNCFYNTTYDINGNCCASSKVDCAGVCDGSAYGFYGYTPSTVSPTGKNYFCCLESEQDCFGVCQGNATRDVCLVCNGTAHSYTQCALDISVSVGAGSNGTGTDLYPLLGPRHTWEVYEISLNNSLSNYSIETLAEVQGAHDTYGPSVTVIAGGNFTLRPNQAGTIFVNVSYAGLVSGAQSAWEVKTVIITANTVNTTHFQGTTRAVNVYPGSSNCSSIVNRDLCLRIPQCIFCLRYPDIRILKEVGGATRRLYADLVPPSNGYAIQVYDDTQYGVCADGFFGDACTAEILSLYGANAGSRTLIDILRFCFVLIAITSTVLLLLS